MDLGEFNPLRCEIERVWRPIEADLASHRPHEEELPPSFRGQVDAAFAKFDAEVARLGRSFEAMWGRPRDGGARRGGRDPEAGPAPAGPTSPGGLSGGAAAPLDR